MLFPDLGQFRSGNIARKKPLQQQSNSPAWVHHAPLPRPLLLLHRSSHTQGDMIDTLSTWNLQYQFSK